jgi:hypothetical protein
MGPVVAFPFILLEQSLIKPEPRHSHALIRELKKRHSFVPSPTDGMLNMR